MWFPIILLGLFAQLTLQETPVPTAVAIVNHIPDDVLWPHGTSSVEASYQTTIVTTGGTPDVATLSSSLPTSAGLSTMSTSPAVPATTTPSFGCRNSVCINPVAPGVTLPADLTLTTNRTYNITWNPYLQPLPAKRLHSLFLIRLPDNENRTLLSNSPADSYIWNPTDNTTNFPYQPDEQSQYLFRVSPDSDGGIPYDGVNFTVESATGPSPSTAGSSAASSATEVPTSSPSPLSAQEPTSENTVAKTGSGGLSTNQKIGIGVGIGLGVPILAALAAGVFFLLRRRAASANNDPYSRQPLDPSHENVVAGGYSKGFDQSPPLPPLPSQPQNGAIAAGAAVGTAAGSLAMAGTEKRDSRHLQPIDTAMPTPATGVDASPVSPLSHRSSVSSMSTVGPGGAGGRTLTFSSEHH